MARVPSLIYALLRVKEVGTTYKVDNRIFNSSPREANY